jgi:circadian clock protein KaiC
MLETLPCITLRKAPTGIPGFDDITRGGLPGGRPSLICGAAGSGKTLFGLTFLVHGAIRYDEPGVFMSFEERSDDLVENFGSLGYDLNALVAVRKLAIDHVRVERSEIDEAGEYDLDGLFVRLGFAIDQIGAKRVVIDTIETLFAGFADPTVLRAELRRLFGWLKDRGVTAIITGEQGEGVLTRHGLEEYVSDCVILLDNRVQDQVATRRLRIVKYRGSAHGTNEYPFLIDSDGISVLPVTSSGLNRSISNDVISSGILGLDAMLGHGGFYRGSSILLSGVPGTGKTLVSSHFIDAACARGETCLFVLFEECAAEVCRNARSIGLDLQSRVDAGMLHFEEARPSLYGLEMHLARMHRDLDIFKPSVVVVDPISAFRGPRVEVHSTLLRMVDLLKSRCITALFTSLRSGASPLEGTDDGLSSLMDSWIKLMTVEESGERNRILYIIKSRGSNHSNQVREYRMTETGIETINAYIGSAGVLTGTARIMQEAREQAVAERQHQDFARRERELSRRRDALDRQIADLRAALEAEEEEMNTLLIEAKARETMLGHERRLIADRRGATL